MIYILIDDAIWEVLNRCNMNIAISNTGLGLDSVVTESGSNWSAGNNTPL